MEPIENRQGRGGDLGPIPLEFELYLGIGSSFLAVPAGSEDDTEKPKLWGGASAVKYQKILVIPNVLCPPPYIINPQGEAMERKTSKTELFRQIPFLFLSTSSKVY